MSVEQCQRYVASFENLAEFGRQLIAAIREPPPQQQKREEMAGHRQAVHPEYIFYENRLNTFVANGWPRAMTIKAEDLAEAGFFYQGTTRADPTCLHACASFYIFLFFCRTTGSRSLFLL